MQISSICSFGCSAGAVQSRGFHSPGTGSAREVLALPEGLITAKRRAPGTKLLGANGTFCFSCFLEDFSSS